MFSLRTKLKLITIIENFTGAELDRLLIAFDLVIPPQENGQAISKAKKANAVLSLIKTNGDDLGPLGGTIQKDLLQYVVDDFYTRNPGGVLPVVDFFDDPIAPTVELEDLFSDRYKELANLLKQDGFIVKYTMIRRLLPQELVTTKVESELERLLDKFGFTITKGHLTQAIEAHSLSSWAAANAQFRTFVESLLIDIARLVVPTAVVANANQAITQLGIAVPCFLSTHLNEVKTPTNPTLNAPFVQGLLNRLHPHGSHPGLSDEEDSTFRYHMVIVFGRYLLDMLDKRP